MRTFNIRVAPSWHQAFDRWGIAQMSAEALEAATPGSNVQLVNMFANGVTDYAVVLRSGTREENLDWLRSQVEQFGFEFLGVAVTEWTTRWCEGALTGLVAGLGVGTKLKSDTAVLVSILVGTAIGAYAGAQLQSAVAPLLAERTNAGGWAFQPQRALPS